MNWIKFILLLYTIMDKLFQQQQAPKKKQNIIVRIKKEQQDITNTPIM